MGDINNMRNVVNSNNSVKSYVINKNIKVSILDETL